MADSSLDIFLPQTARWFHESLGKPTAVQSEAWPVIAQGRHTLVSAPTGTGKTLTAFLVFLDQLKQQAKEGTLKEELQLIYISPLKSLAGDIRENLRKPLDGIGREDGEAPVVAAVRTGDTTQSERRQMVKHPPHILITTPESLYLLLTSKSGKTLLSTARAVIIDELHALIDTKRGAHLMLSLARLDALCGQSLQRIGLSATIEPLSVAAAYLSPDPVAVIAPPIVKRVQLKVTSPLADSGQWMHRDTIWEELADTVYHHCLNSRSVLAFVEGRRFAEKLAYYVNQLGGEGFARTHHGSLSKEQRHGVEADLRDGKLKLLCATSSMELGIDVGEIDQVLQMGCPRTISGTMQRLGRAGHNPGRVSVMHMFPRTAPESLYCGLTAELARQGGVEQAHPPRLCLDVLAQHLVSMAVGGGYTVDDVLTILPRAYSFKEVTSEDIKSVLGMLAGDYEHDREIPVRPRLLYDRINGLVAGDPYSRMLALSTGGTIPDKGMYSVKTADGVKVGELDEEFVYESRIGERFLLGTFAWKIVRQDKDFVVVEQASREGAKLPFWKGEQKGRPMKTGQAFGKLLRRLGEACGEDSLEAELEKLGLDEPARERTAGFLKRQVEATGMLPDDKTLIVEHFKDHTGSSQMMVHSVFGRQVNAPLSLLVQQEALYRLDKNIGCVDAEEGFLLYPYGEEALPEGLLSSLRPETARTLLETMLPNTPLFSMTFRYNAGRALMMGVKKNGRTPLWLQRLRSTEMMDQVASRGEHPLVRETRRECLEDLWDISGVEYVLNGIRAGTIRVHEIHVELPSPMSLPLQWRMEAAVMYDDIPQARGISQAVPKQLEQARLMTPDPEALALTAVSTVLPEDEVQLHSLLMREGDLLAGELDVPVSWLESLIRQGLAEYREPGLWIAAEHKEEYEAALEGMDEEARLHIVRRMLYYRGAMSAAQTAERYFFTEPEACAILELLCSREMAVEQAGLFYHARLYDRARRETVKGLRNQITTLSASRYASLLADRIDTGLPALEQLKRTLQQLSGTAYPAAVWESTLLPARVPGYREALLDSLLAQGEFFWQLQADGSLRFHLYDDIDWEQELSGNLESLSEEEARLYKELVRRGASFLNNLSMLPDIHSFAETLLSLVQKGLVTADSFVPVRQWLGRDRLSKAGARQRVSARVKLQSTGRCDVVRPLKQLPLEAQIELAFDRYVILCRETARAFGLSWAAALEHLRVWEYTGRARRGYFIAGLSGAQFIRAKEFHGIMQALEHPQRQLRWISAADPMQVWGKLVPHQMDKAFMQVQGSAVALYEGVPVVVFERQGRVLRVLEQEYLQEALSVFVVYYKKKRLFPTGKRLLVKEFPPEAEVALQQAGFLREMQDFVLYQ